MLGVLVLLAAPDQVDLRRFELSVANARLIAAAEPRRAADMLRAALGLWRGAPLTDVANEPFAAWAVPRLEELRLSTIAERIDSDLALVGTPSWWASWRTLRRNTPSSGLRAN